MDRLQTIESFVAVSEEQSFSAAARRLKVSPPVITRAVAELERQLGVKLLNRTTRLVRPTEAGLRYAEDARRLLEELKLADEAAAGINAEPRGELVVTAPVLFGQKYIMPGIIDYLESHPETHIRALFVDRIVNLLEEGIDVGIRIGELPDSTMRALKVGAVRSVVVASDAYLEKHGLPRSPEDLRNHVTIASNAAGDFIGWRFKSARPLRLDHRLVVSSNRAAIDAARAGFGVTRVLSYQVAEQLESGELTVILETFEQAQTPINIVHHEGRHSAARIRAFIDLMTTRLRSDSRLQ